MNETPKAIKLLCPACHRAELVSTTDGASCSECLATFRDIQGILSLMPSAMNVDLRETYEQKAAQEGETVKTVGYACQSHHQAMQQAFRVLLKDMPQGRTILDVGCGNGLFSAFWAGTHRMVGVDFSINMLKLARRNGLEVYHADANTLPFANDQFDAVICAEVIQHFEDALPVLGEMARVVKPGGWVLVSTLNAHSLVRRSFRAVYHRLPFVKGPGFSTVLRTLDQMVDYGNMYSLKKDKVALVYFPFQFVRVFDSPGGLNQRLASNFAIRFVKR